MSRSIRKTGLMLALAGTLVAGGAGATTYSDNFTGTSASLQWTALSDACLTAGSGAGSIPSCKSKGFLTDPAGQGALLLTPAQDDQTGAILSAFPPFPVSQGIQITFTTYTYGGDSGGTAGDGADGIVFFLTDGTQSPPTTTGAEGGSMGYGCSNVNPVYNGVAYGYLGLGIDEFGNFLNTGDNGTNPFGGIYNSRNSTYGTTAYGDNTYQNNVNGPINSGSGPQYQPQRIGLRGAGNTNWAWLIANGDPTYYTGSSNEESDVQAACSSGTYVSSHTTTTTTNKYGKTKTKTTYNYSPIPYNYNAIPGGYAVLPDSEPIANEAATTLNPASGQPAPWPITYKLTISSTGLLNFAYSYNNGDFVPVLSNFNITTANGPLPALLRFGFSAGTGGDDNVHEITCFTASPLQANSGAATSTQGGQVIPGVSQVFLPAYSTDNWWGSLAAYSLVVVDGSIIFQSTANWDAKCVLTGGPCDSMGVNSSGTPTTSIAVQAPADRTLLTSTALGAGNGVPLAWNDLSTAEQNALNVATSNSLDATPGENRVAWLTGVRSDEQLAAGCTSPPGADPSCDLRARTYVLGDIINSTPTYVPAPVPGALPNTWSDEIDPTTAPTPPENAAGAQTYGAFAASEAGRLDVVYVGSNDGFVHGFEAGVDGNGTPGATDNDGKEVVGYMPYDVLMGKAVNLASPLYAHDYLVDATPADGDVFYANAWHTWLVGGVGSTGDEIYALNVTNPASETASDVIGDWDNTTLTHLGATVGQPVIARMHNGDWAIIFGSGLVTPPATGAPAAPTEGVYIGLIDPTTGAVTFQFLNTGVEPTGLNGAAGGIAYVSSVDLDDDGIVDYLYAGDADGNVWRFDVTSANASQWTVSTFGNPGPTPLFVATNPSGGRQPITTSIILVSAQTGLVTREMLYFGTGEETQATASQGVQYAQGQQTFYGIWDWDMGNWNSLSNAKYASLPEPQTFTRSDLLAQKVQTPPSTATLRYLSNTNVVCWEGDAPSTQCPTENQYGWLFDLPNTGPATGELAGQQEQIIYNPGFNEGAVTVNTAIPPEISAAQCNPGLQTGFSMAFDPTTGGGFAQDFFQNASGGFSSGSATAAGSMTNAVGTSTFVQFGSSTGMVNNTSGAGGGTGGQNGSLGSFIPTNAPPNTTPARVSWSELVNP